MFLLEAIPTFVMGLVVLLVMIDRVEQAEWRDDDEKRRGRADLDEDNQQKACHSTVKAFVANRRLWLLALIYFCVVMGQYALTFWLPTLVRNSGISQPLHIGLLTSLPYLCAILFMLLAGRSGDRHRERRWHLIVPMLVGGVSAAAGIAAVNCIANLAGFFSPWLIGAITTATGSPASGMYFIAAVLLRVGCTCCASGQLTEVT